MSNQRGDAGFACGGILKGLPGGGEMLTAAIKAIFGARSPETAASMATGKGKARDKSVVCTFRNQYFSIFPAFFKNLSTFEPCPRDYV